MSDFFSLFGMPRRFGLDRADLEKRFYELSRTFHPDRFTTASAEERQESLKKMSALNEAYRTLKDPSLTREYLLSLEGADANDSKTGMPMDLTESWFELQDAMTENRDAAMDKLAAFELELAEVKRRNEASLLEVEQAIDSRVAAESLWKRLSALVQERNYLKSLERDVERIRLNYD